MINHIKTLFANVDHDDAELLDIGFFVDPSFVPTDLPVGLDSVRKLLVGSDPRTSIRTAFSIVSRLDISKYLKSYDTRLEPDVVSDEAAISGLSGSDECLSDFNTKQTEEYLFTLTGVVDMDTAIKELEAMYRNDVDGYNRIAAMILALVVRLEYFNSLTINR